MSSLSQPSIGRSLGRGPCSKRVTIAPARSISSATVSASRRAETPARKPCIGNTFVGDCIASERYPRLRFRMVSAAFPRGENPLWFRSVSLFVRFPVETLPKASRDFEQAGGAHSAADAHGDDHVARLPPLSFDEGVAD